jgi:8-oxo-dGTP pyrophosphatase MutT (NUDIX family)
MMANDRMAEYVSAAKRLPLWIGLAHVGSVLPSDVSAYASLAPYLNPAQGLVLPDTQPLCNALLAQWASDLSAAGRLKAWRNELLGVAALPPPKAVLDTLPAPLAQVERGAARVLGILTHAVHLVGFSSTGGIWMQQRALGKSTDPGLWDTLSGGLLSAGDSLLSGVLRETHEEAGLLATDLLNITACGMIQQNRMVADGHILEAVWTYTAMLRDDVLPHNLDGEAMGFACLTRSELTALVAAKKVTQEAVLSLRMAGAL